MNDLFCSQDDRRRRVRSAPLFGLDYAEVSSDDQRSLEVFFLGKAPKSLSVANIRICGGRRVRDLRVARVHVQRRADPTLDDYLEIRLNEAGDFSDYTLSLVALDENGQPTGEPLSGFDPLYSSVVVQFKAGCPSDLDCKVAASCAPPARTNPDINYLAKDYASFRQLIVDRLAQSLPSWREQHVPDIGILLVELLAYVADSLSYFQDAVATEAYLDTARQRISVRRHARLVDYTLHEGCNARTWLTLLTAARAELDPQKVFFTTQLPDKPLGTALRESELQDGKPRSYEVFEALVADPAKPIVLRPAHSEIHFYTWGNGQCCLGVGATTATLEDSWLGEQRALELMVGDVLIFEEVVGPRTGNPADADPSHRQAVRLTKVTPTLDPLLGPGNADRARPLVEIEWCCEDALTFPLCISATMPAPSCEPRGNLSVARGNVVLVDHGAQTHKAIGRVPVGSTREVCADDCQPRRTELTPGRFCPTIEGSPLTFAQPLPLCGCASGVLQQDPRRALPWISLLSSEVTAHEPVQRAWTPLPDLLESGASDANFVVEVDDAGVAHLRFGDGELGRLPPSDSEFAATYRVGCGSVGNVGADTIVQLVCRDAEGDLPIVTLRNPLPATGGVEPESVAEVKLFAPAQFRRVIERAITAADYASLAADNARRLAERPDLVSRALLQTRSKVPIAPEQRAAQEEEAEEEGSALGPELCSARFQALQGAKGRARWTGSFNQIFVAIDPLGCEDPSSELRAEIAAYLDRYRRIGHDVSVQAAAYVGIDLGLHVCVEPHFLRGHVEAALSSALGSRPQPGGALGLFHPDQLSFGEGLFGSRIIAAAQAVQGVASVALTRLMRFEPGMARPGARALAGEVPANGVLVLGPFEIARLDDDPNFPEHGRLTLDLRGGR